MLLASDERTSLRMIAGAAEGCKSAGDDSCFPTHATKDVWHGWGTRSFTGEKIANTSGSGLGAGRDEEGQCFAGQFNASGKGSENLAVGFYIHAGL